MNRLLSAGFYRLFRNRLFVGILLFMAAMAVIIPAVIHSEMVKYQLEGSIETVLGIHTAFTGFFTAVHQIIISVVGRILISPFTISLPEALAFFGVSILLGASFSAIYTALAKTSQSKAVAAVLCLVAAIVLFVISFYITARLSQPETISGYELNAAGEVILTGEEPNPNYVSGSLRAFYEFLSYFLPFGQMFHFSQLDTGRKGIMALYDLVILAGATLTGMAVFGRKDLK